MTQEEKQLLLKDLCARLPYGVLVYTDYDNIDCPILLKEFSYDGEYYAVGGEYTNLRGIIFNKHPCKPYLRPGSDATLEEINTSDRLFMDGKSVEAIDYLLSRHIDIHGLLPMGLALKASKEMYNLKEK